MAWEGKETEKRKIPKFLGCVKLAKSRWEGGGGEGQQETVALEEELLESAMRNLYVLQMNPALTGFQDQRLLVSVLKQVEAGEAKTPSRFFETFELGLSSKQKQVTLACHRRSPLGYAGFRAAPTRQIPSDLSVLVASWSHLALSGFNPNRLRYIRAKCSSLVACLTSMRSCV